MSLLSQISPNPLLLNKFDIQTSLLNLCEKVILNNSKFFLECYKATTNKSRLSKKFIEECPLYCEESQTPDIYESLQNQYNRNLAFYIRHGPYNKYNKTQNYIEKMGQNLFPKIPITLSPFCQLEMNSRKLLKKFEEEKNNNKTDDNVKIKEIKIEDIFGKDLNEIKKEKIISTLSQFNKNKINVRMPGKVWIFKVGDEKNYTVLGPYTSEFVYHFLTFFYFPQIKKGNILFGGLDLLINDVDSDMHYQPELVYDHLKQQKEIMDKLKGDKKEIKSEFKDINFNDIFNNSIPVNKKEE